MRSAAERRHALKTATFTQRAHGAKSIGSANGSFQIVTDLGDIWEMVVMNSRTAVDCVRGERIRPANTSDEKDGGGNSSGYSRRSAEGHARREEEVAPLQIRRLKSLAAGGNNRSAGNLNG